MDVLIAMDLATNLQLAGYEIAAIARDGEEAVSKAMEVQPDLIIMDIDLPGTLDGISAAKIIRRLVRTKIVFASGHHDHDPRIQQILSEGIHPFIRKPYYGDTLSRFLATL